jgi:ribokinase
MSGQIVVVGSLNMDLVVRALRHPQPGETLLGSDFGTFPGGKGANQAVAAARLSKDGPTSGQVRMVGRVGQDAFGDELLETVTRSGVDARYIQRDPAAPTGVAVITLDSAGQNTIVVAPGANGQLAPKDIEAAADAFNNAAVLLVQLESPLPSVLRAIQLAKEHGARVVLNPSPAQPLDLALLSQVDYLVPNEHELAALSRMVDRAAAVSRLRDEGVARLVVTLGGDGVLVSDELGEAYLPAYPVNVVDTTAAGDAFVGAFAVALTEGATTLDAARWGNAAGALAVTRAGASCLAILADLEPRHETQGNQESKNPEKNSNSIPVSSYRIIFLKCGE